MQALRFSAASLCCFSPVTAPPLQEAIPGGGGEAGGHALGPGWGTGVPPLCRPSFALRCNSTCNRLPPALHSNLPPQIHLLALTRGARELVPIRASRFPHCQVENFPQYRRTSRGRRGSRPLQLHCTGMARRRGRPAPWEQFRPRLRQVAGQCHTRLPRQPPAPSPPQTPENGALDGDPLKG